MDAIIIASLGLGFVVCVVLIVSGIRHNKANIYLGLSLFSIWYILAINYLNDSGNMLYFPHLARTGQLFAYLLMPFLYLFVRQNFYPGSRLRTFHAVLFFPALLYFIDMIPFLLKPAAEKIRIWQVYLQNLQEMNAMRDGWLMPPWFHYYFRYSWGAFVFFLIVRLLYRNRNQYKEQAAAQNKPLYQFMVVMTSLYFFLVFPGAFGMFLKSGWYNLAFISWNFMIILMAAAIYLIASPRILYGFAWQPTTSQLKEVGLLDEASPEEPTQERSAESSLPLPPVHSENSNAAPEKELEWELQIIQLIRHEMAVNQLYLNQGFTIHDLASHTRIPVYQLSPVINKHTGSNFNSWLNQFRIEHFLDLVKSGQHQHLTLEALAFQSGFNSRITFYNAFKKIKGSTPTEYLRKAGFSH